MPRRTNRKSGSNGPLRGTSPAADAQPTPLESLKKIFGDTRNRVMAIIAAVITVGAVLKGIFDGFAGYEKAYNAAAQYLGYKAKPSDTKTVSSTASPPRAGTSQKPAERLSVVVLPFSFIGPRDSEFLADAVTDDLISTLSRVKGSFVISRNTSSTYRGKAIDTKQIAQELGVKYVLEGSLQKDGSRYRIVAQLVDADQQVAIWSDRFEGERTDFLALQNDAITRLGRALNIELIQADAARIAREKLTKPAALDLTALGWASILKPRSKDNMTAAAAYFRSALDADATAVDAMAGLAASLAIIVSLGWSSDSAADNSMAASLIEKALAIDPKSAAAYFARGWLYKIGRSQEGLAAFEAALNLNPNFPDAARQAAESYLWAGRPQDCLDATEVFLRHSPRDPNLGIITWSQGYSLLLLGRHQEALPYLLKARVLNPQFWGMHFLLASALALNGDIDGARSALAEVKRLRPDMTSVSVLYKIPRTDQFRALSSKTLDVGLQLAGLPLNE